MNYFPRGIVLCLGPTSQDCENQAKIASTAGCTAVEICPDARGKYAISGFLDREHLATLNGFEVVALWSNEEDLRLTRASLAEHMDKFIPLVATTEMEEFLFHERLVCTDTTAAGGNATLFAMMGKNFQV